MAETGRQKLTDQIKAIGRLNFEGFIEVLSQACECTADTIQQKIEKLKQELKCSDKDLKDSFDQISKNTEDIVQKIKEWDNVIVREGLREGAIPGFLKDEFGLSKISAKVYEQGINMAFVKEHERPLYYPSQSYDDRNFRKEEIPLSEQKDSQIPSLPIDPNLPRERTSIEEIVPHKKSSEISKESRKIDKEFKIDEQAILSGEDTKMREKQQKPRDLTPFSKTAPDTVRASRNLSDPKPLRR
ncbi:MAG: hypothetical protein LBJ09_00890 [Clostridiales bacterium]|jgi:hypothetical protein|nr:hypothetical protein [Clostridiales bacterium]